MEWIKRVIRTRYIFFSIPIKRTKTCHKDKLLHGHGVATLSIAVWLSLKGITAFRRVIVTDEHSTYFTGTGDMQLAMDIYYGRVDLAMAVNIEEA